MPDTESPQKKSPASPFAEAGLIEPKEAAPAPAEKPAPGRATVPAAMSAMVSDETLTWDTTPSTDEDDETVGTFFPPLPLKPMLGGAALAALTLCTIVALRITGPGPETALASPPTPAEGVETVQISTDARGGSSYLCFAVLPTQDEADAAAFKLWGERIDVTVEPGEAGTGGWRVMGTAAFEPTSMDEAIAAQAAAARTLGFDPQPISRPVATR